MAQSPCPYCRASEGRCVVAGGGRFLTECKSCGRVMEERSTEVSEMYFERAYDAPLCIVTPDFSVDEAYKAPTIEDDPFENISFITTFSTWSLERAPLFTETSTSYGGQLAELERLLYEATESQETSVANGSSLSAAETLRAYFQIQEISSLLGFERDTSDHAFQLFKECLATPSLRNRNIEALATAAVVQASREGQEPRTLQEISVAANVSPKDIGKHMKMLSDALNLSQPINSNSISAHMPRFCQLLALSKTTQDLATHIGEVVINKNFCTRRNPVSISAAAIYLSCQVEDKRKTQTEICKATGLTEVTLRKVYKELVEHLHDILPPDYTPAISLEKIFPASNGPYGRNHPRTSPSIAGSDPAIPRPPFPSKFNNTSPGSIADSRGRVGGSGSGSPLVQSNRTGVPVSGTPADERITAPAAPFSNGRLGMPSFTVPSGNLSLIPGNGVMEGSLHDNVKDGDLNARETQERALDRKQADYAGPMNINMMPSPAAIPGMLPPGFWPLPPFYSTGAPPVPVRSEDAAVPARPKEKIMEDVAGTSPLANSNLSQHPQYLTANLSNQPQFVTLVRGMPDDLSSSMQASIIPAVPVPPGRQSDVLERQGTPLEGREHQQSEKKRDHDVVGTGERVNHSTVPILGPNSAAAIQTYAVDSSGRQVPQAFSPMPSYWPFFRAFASGHYGVYPPHLVPPPGGLPPGFYQVGGGEEGITSEKKVDGLQQGLLASASAEAVARMAGGPGIAVQQAGLGGQANPLAMHWAGGAGPFHPLYVAPHLNLAPVPTPGLGPGSVGSGAAVATINTVPNAMHGGNSVIDRNTRLSPDGGGMISSHRPTTAAADRFPVLSMAIGNSHGQLGESSGRPSSAANRAATPSRDGSQSAV